MNPKTSKITALLGTASFLALATSLDAQAQQVAQAQMAQASPMEVPEQVLITGSLIHEAERLGVPVPLHQTLYRLIKAKEESWL